MKIMKQLLIITVLLFYSLVVSAHDFEIGGIFYKITSMTDLTVEVTYEGGSYNEFSDEYIGGVVIPSIVTYKSKTLTVTSISDRAFAGCTGLTSVTIPDSVTHIGDRAFEGCTSLINVHISDSCAHIGARAFYGCSNLENVNIPESITFIPSSLFKGCSSLDYVNIPEKVTRIEYAAFRDCSLDSINIPQSVEKIESYAFDFSGLQTIIIPKSVMQLGNSSCNGIREIIFEGTDVPISVDHPFSSYAFNVSTLHINRPLKGSLFYESSYNYSSIKTIYIGKFVKWLGDNLFRQCSNNIENIIVEYSEQPLYVGTGGRFFDHSRHDYYWRDFFYGMPLKNVSISRDIIIEYDPSEAPGYDCVFQTNDLIENVSIGYIHKAEVPKSSSGGFRYYELGGVYENKAPSISFLFPRSQVKSLKLLDNYIYDVNISQFPSSLETITVDDDNPKYSILDGALYNKNYTKFIGYPASFLEFKDYDLSAIVDTLESYSFSGCTDERIVLPQSIKYIGGKVFTNCSQLSCLYLRGEIPPKLSTSAFAEEQYALVTLYVPVGSKTKYEMADVWQNFWDIQEFDATGVEDITTNHTAIKITGDGILLLNAEGKIVTIYAVNGTVVSNINNYNGEKIVLNKGIYIVRVGNKIIKVKL